jgi:hypothetical protein
MRYLIAVIPVMQDIDRTGPAATTHKERSAARIARKSMRRPDESGLPLAGTLPQVLHQTEPY